MALILFDLDNTLLADDSDYLWGQYLCDLGVVDREDYEIRNQLFYKDYLSGNMDIHAFLSFALAPLKQLPLPKLLSLRADFVATQIDSIIAPGAAGLIEKHRNRGDTLVVITATNRFITAPIVSKLGIPHLIATEPTIGATGFDGDYQPPACFQAGKLERLSIWLKTYRIKQEGSYAYSDSHNDLALLEWADFPHAVDPDEKLKTAAINRKWPVISLR
ncbi:MAG: HAD-IB family hydrolase [Immundisolibacteraceae bacterium]|nr:HAD-IB family hydrolase [Immundisolibacteraceae bacterium]